MVIDAALMPDRFSAQGSHPAAAFDTLIWSATGRSSASTATGKPEANRVSGQQPRLRYESAGFEDLYQIVVLTTPEGVLCTPAELTATISKYQVPELKLVTT